MNLKRIFIYQSLVACVLLLGMNVALWAQGATATVTGRVSDATGAILTGSNVTITNTATNVQYKTVTNNAGVKGGAKPGHCGGVKVGQLLDVKWLSIWGRRGAGA
jgi:hypothetical protein